MFLNKILTNAEIWYDIKENELGDLEDLDRYLIRKAFQCPVTTPKEAYHLELGLLPISCILKCRRLNYLQYIVKSDENGMLCKFFNTMYESLQRRLVNPGDSGFERFENPRRPFIHQISVRGKI